MHTHRLPMSRRDLHRYDTLWLALERRVAVAQALGATGTRVHALETFTPALRAACGGKGVSLIEVVLPPDDISLPLRRLRDRLRPPRPAP